ncbi:MAG: polyphosphate kinase 1 [Elusimicrobia bacterium]|nr:polyphosphate kinase 1 [Elusimicrobiota bacterium]
MATAGGVHWLDLRAGRAPAAASAKPPLVSRLFNRDLSWLNFNERVLNEAADPSVPPLERLRFAAIVSSNLDEFFMVRVAEISRFARLYPSRKLPDGITMSRLLPQIRERVLQQKARQAKALEDILQSLAEHRTHIYADFTRFTKFDRLIHARLPPIKYVLRRSSEPPPVLSSGRIHIFVRFPREYAILTIPAREDRILRLPAAKSERVYALADRWLCARAGRFFPGREVIEAFPFKIIREADIRYRPDDEDSIEEQIAIGVERRDKAKVVRVEVDAPSYSEGTLFLASSLGAPSNGLYRFPLPLDLRTLASVYSDDGAGHLRYPHIAPRTPVFLKRRRGLFASIRKHDTLLHHPYDSFDSVVEFLGEAARDPHVTRIYHVMYRTSRHSPVMEALTEAARRGKKVTAYVEIKARFDELNNLRWAQELRRAGVRVVRPMGRFKVHSKVTQIFRKEGNEEISYLHLGTGNYHPGTARQYTDLGLLTADKALGEDIAKYFQLLTRRAPPSVFQEILVSPNGLQKRVVELIAEEARIQKSGGRGHIIGKMNSLVDPEIIEALYQASAAGVKIDLIVRGICCLRPGIKGLSENIRVTSIVDRFLEHSRVFYFRAAGAEKIYLSSADWMPRNFYARYEIAFPVKDADLKRCVRDIILNVSLADNVKAWNLKADGTYEKILPARGGKTVRSQNVFESLATIEYRGTVLEKRFRPS